MTSFEAASKAVAIVEELAKCEPVYGPVKGPSAVRICALCHAKSEDHGENVTHEASCPWLPAKELVKRIHAQLKADGQL